MQSTKFEFLINLQTARLIDIEVLATANEAIQQCCGAQSMAGHGKVRTRRRLDLDRDGPAREVRPFRSLPIPIICTRSAMTARFFSYLKVRGSSWSQSLTQRSPA
jgi:hypothetical protein